MMSTIRKRKMNMKKQSRSPLAYSADGMEDEPHVDGESIEMEAEVISSEEYTEEISGDAIFRGGELF